MNPETATADLLTLMSKIDRPAIWELDPDAAREQNDPLSETAEHLPENVARIEDLLVDSEDGDIPVRIYWPSGLSALAPMLLFYHGGGGVICNIDTHDSVCRTLAQESGCITISVGYRLAPEHKFPAGLKDAITAFEWVTGNADNFGGDRNRIAISGDSCGGGIAAAAAQILRQKKTMPICQLLIYPAVDAKRNATLYPSYADNAYGYFLERPLIDWFQQHYLKPDQDLADPSLSPVFNSNLRALPPTIIITAGFDPLRDEGFRYAKMLKEAGISVEYRCFESTIHGFVSMGRYIPLAIEALQYCGNALRQIVSTNVK